MYSLPGLSVGPEKEIELKATYMCTWTECSAKEQNEKRAKLKDIYQNKIFKYYRYVK